jgi:hypothetical protein
MKEGGCWMIFESGDFTADHVRARMGNFSREHSGPFYFLIHGPCTDVYSSVAKFSARMGLCFSSSSHAVELQSEDIEIIPDVKHSK